MLIRTDGLWVMFAKKLIVFLTNLAVLTLLEVQLANTF